MSKDRAYLSGATYCAPWYDLRLPNVKLAYKKILKPNALAYLSVRSVTEKEKGFMQSQLFNGEASYTNMTLDGCTYPG